MAWHSKHYFLTVSMVRNLASVYLGALGQQASDRLWSRCLLGRSFSRESVVITVIISRIQLLKDGLAEGLSSLLGVGQRPPLAPHHVGHSAVQHLTSPRVRAPTEQGKDRE